MDQGNMSLTPTSAKLAQKAKCTALDADIGYWTPNATTTHPGEGTSLPWNGDHAIGNAKAKCDYLWYMLCYIQRNV